MTGRQRAAARVSSDSSEAVLACGMGREVVLGTADSTRGVQACENWD